MNFRNLLKLKRDSLSCPKIRLRIGIWQWRIWKLCSRRWTRSIVTPTVRSQSITTRTLRKWKRAVNQENLVRLLSKLWEEANPLLRISLLVKMESLLPTMRPQLKGSSPIGRSIATLRRIQLISLCPITKTPRRRSDSRIIDTLLREKEGVSFNGFLASETTLEDTLSWPKSSLTLDMISLQLTNVDKVCLRDVDMFTRMLTFAWLTNTLLLKLLTSNLIAKRCLLSSWVTALEAFSL